MNYETRRVLNSFVAREYQIPLIDALENKGYKKILAIWSRRAGKDIVCWNLAIRQCIRKVCTVFYIFPTYAQAKKVIWNSITNDGKQFVDFIPKELIESKNSQEMKITFINGSILQLIGSDNVDSIIGTNPYGCVFSEYAIQDPKAYQFIRPILTANNGWVILISTPRGRNSFWELYQIAQHHPDWFVYKLTVEDTQHISLKDIEREKSEGIMSEDLILQEYYCSFDMGIEGAYYTKYIDKMRLNSQIGQVPYEPGFKVHTAWDLGVRDSTAIIFFQTIGQSVRIIDCYENSKVGLEHYAKILAQKDYLYGKHIAPHDIMVKELGTGMTRIEKAKNLGIKFTVAPNISIEDGIESVRSTLPKIWLDEEKCQSLLKAVINYRQEYDSKRRVYCSVPLHDWSSHFCFSGDMKVLTPSGSIKIKDIKEGDSVITPLGIRKVLKTHKRMTKDLCIINKNIECTPEHFIFMQSGLSRADTLRYNDILEPYSKFRSYLWKKIFGYYTEGQDIKGFKKTISSLKMKCKSCLMDTFIDGMRQNIIWGDLEESMTEQRLVEKVALQHYKDIFGKNIKAQFQRVMSCITKMVIPKTMISQTLKFSLGMSTDIYIPQDRILGVNPKNVLKCCSVSMKKQKNGTEAKKEENGTKIMRKIHYQLLKKLDTQRFVLFVKKNIQQHKHGKNTVAINVKQDSEYYLAKILKKGFVRFAVKSLNVINMLSRKHAVKNVEYNHLDTLKEVYDLTIEHDNCYYINGYLVSNCDALRYLCVTLPKTRDGLSPEELDKRYQEAIYVDGQRPPFFR